MNIVMLTNTYSPHVGGVARSVTSLSEGLKRHGHKVLIVAPQFPGAPEKEEGVIRIPAVQKFAGSDFSVPLPLSRLLSDDLETFKPEVVHSHHPFLLGDTALRVSAARNIPVVFTFHTRYELYGHYVAQDSELLKRLVLSLSTGYCNLCDAVIAPSESIERHLRDHGVTAPVTVIPTGIDLRTFGSGNRQRSRRANAIPDDAFVVGHVGRLAAEKNLVYLAKTLAGFLQTHPAAIATITGDGPVRDDMAAVFAAARVDGRVRFTGVLTGSGLCDAYAAMDVFAFASHSETQGLVLAEAMAAGVPVVALDAPGAREVVRNGVNGLLLPANIPQQAFAQALHRIASLEADAARRMCHQAHKTAAAFSSERCIGRTEELYRDIALRKVAERDRDDSLWQSARRSLAREMDILGNLARAVGDAVGVTSAPQSKETASP